MLPQPERTQAVDLLREYVNIRLAAVQAGMLEEGTRRSGEIQNLLWDQAMSATSKDSRSIPIGLFVQSLNQLIDLHAQRLMVGLHSRIPIVIWFVLIFVAALSFGSMGYQSGLTGARCSPAVLPLALTFAVVLWMVVDLDRPQEGLLRVSQQPMIELRSMMDDSTGRSSQTNWPADARSPIKQAVIGLCGPSDGPFCRVGCDFARRGGCVTISRHTSPLLARV